MGKMIENPKYSIISARVSDAEFSEIVNMAEDRGVSISELIRMLLNKEQNNE